MNISNIYPILENLHWLKHGSFNIPLFLVDKKGYDFPAIAFINQNDDKTQTIIEDIEGINLSGSELVRLAFKNLQVLPLEWERQKLNGSPILALEAEWAAEKILDTAFLMEASEILQSPQIMVGIPKRGMILAAPYHKSNTDIVFSTYVLELYEDMGCVPLSDKLYIIENGKITGLNAVTVVRNKTQNSQKNSVTIKVKNEISTKIVKKAFNTGTESYVVTLGTHDFDDFANAAYQIILDILDKNEDNPNFNGLIEFNILSEWLPKSIEFEKTLSVFIERLQMQANLSSAAHSLRKDIAITFIHLSDLETGNTHLKRRLKISSTY
jgi:hypothetical protein